MLLAWNRSCQYELNTFILALLTDTMSFLSPVHTLVAFPSTEMSPSARHQGRISLEYLKDRFEINIYIFIGHEVLEYESQSHVFMPDCQKCFSYIL